MGGADVKVPDYPYELHPWLRWALAIIAIGLLFLAPKEFGWLHVVSAFLIGTGWWHRGCSTGWFLGYEEGLKDGQRDRLE